MSDPIDITGLDKAELLAALYNEASPLGVGWVHHGADPNPLRPEDAGRYLAAMKESGQPLRFDYLNGRPLKIDLSGDVLHPWLYDRDQGGPGSAARVVARLRASASRVCCICKGPCPDNAPREDRWSWGPDGMHCHARCEDEFRRRYPSLTPR